MSEMVCGLDLGQTTDYTALVVGETRFEGADLFVDLLHVERFKLGTSYPAIVAQVRGLMSTHPLSRQVPVVCDGTGVGRAIVDMFRETDLALVPVSIHGGEANAWEGGYWHVAKKHLVGIVQVLLQTKRLKIDRRLPHAELLVRELTNFTVAISPQGRATFSAREGEHDDLVLAVALCCFYAAQGVVRGGAAAVGERTAGWVGSSGNSFFDSLGRGYGGQDAW